MRIVIRVLGALLFVGAAALARREAGLARAEADAWEQLATLRYDEAPPRSQGRRSGRGSGPASPIRWRRADLEATVEYWLGRYDDLSSSESGATDADLLLRRGQRGVSIGAPRSDRRPRGGAAARSGDARLRQRAPGRAKSPRRGLQPRVRVAPSQSPRRAEAATAEDREPPRAARPIETTDLPRGPTVHGLPGGPPPEQKMEEIEVLTPRGFEERDADPEQAPGVRMRRKG